MGASTPARHETHPTNHLDPLDDEARLAGAARHSGAPKSDREAAAPLGKVGSLDRRHGFGSGGAIKKVEAELIVATHRPPARQRGYRSRHDRLAEKRMLGGIRTEAAGSEEIRHGVIHR